jgi:hypothetical protein
MIQKFQVAFIYCYQKSRHLAIGTCPLATPSITEKN